MKVLQKDWLLDEAAWDLLSTALHPQREASAARYEEIRQTLIRYFRTHGSLVPEENADEVFNRVARKLGEGEQLDLSGHNGYFLTVARFVLSEYFRAAKRKFVPIDEIGPESEAATDPLEESENLRKRIEHELGLEAVRYCKGQLPDADRDLLDTYDKGAGREKIDRRNGLAERLGKTKAALAVEISRLKAKVRDCTVKKLRDLGLIEAL